MVAGDFMQLYPSIPQKDLLRRVRTLVRFAFYVQTRKFQSAGGSRAHEAVLSVRSYPYCKDVPAVWHFGPKPLGSDSILYLSARDLCELIEHVVNNSYVTFDDDVYQLLRGIPTGTNCAPELTNLYLLYYELTYFSRMLRNWASLSEEHRLFLRSFKRFIDDIWVIADEPMQVHLYKSDDQDGIYPKRLRDFDGSWIENPLQITGTFGGVSCDYLDLTTSIVGVGTGSRIVFRMYDKREHLAVGGIKLATLRNFPHVETALTASCKINVLTSQLFRYNRRTQICDDFIQSTVKLVNKMVAEGYSAKKLVMKVKGYRKHWTPSLGNWSQVLRMILAILRRQELI